jgi:predicted nucleotidyltransferase
MEDEPIAARHNAVIERLSAAAVSDERITGAWLQGSRADGSEDLFSDIDFGVSVVDEHFEAFDKLAFVSKAARVLVHAEPFPGLIACLVDVPA